MGNRNLGVARHFHESTKHSFTSVRTTPHTLDWANRPLPYKIYANAGAIALPRELELSTIPATTAMAGRIDADPRENPFDLDVLARVLFCAGGLTRSRPVGGERYHFRAAASAGALYPIEIYVAAAGVEGAENGLYHFSPADLKLRGLRRGDWRSRLAQATAARPSIEHARAVLMFTAIFWRSAWKYRARAYRYCFWDAGTILANLLAAANAEGLPAEIVTAFADSQVEELLAIDGEREGAICIVALGHNHGRPPASPPLQPLELETVPLSAREHRYGELIELHRESILSSSQEVRAELNAPSRHRGAFGQPAAAPEAAPLETSLGLGETILRRGSTRVFAPDSIAASDLAEIMATAKAPLPLDFDLMVEPYLVVNAVDGMESGAYFYHRASGAFELLKSGDFRGNAGYLCLEQPLGAECSALICYMTDLERALEALGNRGYRDIHLEAGILAGRAYLAAYSLSLGATGLTFYDDDTTAFFSPHAARKSPLLMVALGVPRSSAASPGGDD